MTPASASSPAVLLVVNSGAAARYLLRTDIFLVLKRRGLRIVIVSPNSDEAYFQKEFADPSVAFERLEVERCRAYVERSPLRSFLRNVRANTFRNASAVTTIRDHRSLFEASIHTRGLRPRAYKLAAGIAMRVLARSFVARRLLNWFEGRFFRGDFHRRIFEEYRPALVVTTSLGYWHPDEFIMREARHHGALVVPVILSWDNPSAKGMAGARFDRVIVWTDAMRTELIDYHDAKAPRVFVGGVAHFDKYYEPGALMSRSEVLRHWGLEDGRRLIVFATKSPHNYPWNAEIVELLADAIERGAFDDPCQMLVRVHPIHMRTRGGTQLFRSVMDEYRAIEKKFRFVRFDYPQVVSEMLPLDLAADDMLKLGSMLRHADVLVNILSTMALEATIFDLPVVHVAFEGSRVRKSSPRHSIAIDLAQEHNQRAIHLRGARLATDPGELMTLVNMYLRDRSVDADGRSAVRAAECGPHPGDAGRRIGEYLAGLVERQ